MYRPAVTAPRLLHTGLALLLVLSLVVLTAGCDRRGETKIEKQIVEVPVDNPDTDPGPETPLEDQWAGSGHADEDAEAFRHWDDVGAVPASCAKCHSTHGFRDFLGDDGTPAGVVDGPAAIDSTIECEACHNDAAVALDSVTFPSGAHVPDLGAEARCMQCHQGRESTVSMDAHIAAAGVGDDEQSAALSFRNIHYFAAGVTLYGGLAQGAYQYAGMIYDGKNPHVVSHDTCIECHDAHTLEVKVQECRACHTDVVSKADLGDIRMAGSVRDYDGDGDDMEGLKGEIATMTANLLTAIKAYAKTANGFPIGYDSHAYPYYFHDSNDDGMIDASEANFGNRYVKWTPRLLRAAYNYQYSQKDPGTFAHNPKYMLECLYDSLADLNSHALVTVPDFDKMWRNDTGHFDATAEAYRHWDDDEDDLEPGSIDKGDVSESCARCHSEEGFNFWAEFGVDITRDTQVADGLSCESCHVSGDFGSPKPARKYIEKVVFPSDVEIANDKDNPDDSFICMSCHIGRESKKTVDAIIATGKLSFRNVHYLPAGSVLYGEDAGVGYEYDGNSYEGKWEHYGTNAARCTVCHLDDHTFEPQFNEICDACHKEAAGDLHKIRLFRTTDYDGDGSSTEPLADEVATFGNRLYEAIQDHANNVIGKPIGYDDHTYPYFMNDTDGDGIIQPGEASYGNQYRSWDDALLKASFNFQMWKKEPGAWAHNTHYILQLLYDSIEDLKGDLTGLTRP